MADQTTTPTGIFGIVTHSGGAGPLVNAGVQLLRRGTRAPTGAASSGNPAQVDLAVTGSRGEYHFEGQDERGTFYVQCTAFGAKSELLEVDPGRSNDLDVDLGFGVMLKAYHDEALKEVDRGVVGRPVVALLSAAKPDDIRELHWVTPRRAGVIERGPQDRPTEIELLFGRSGPAHIEARAVDRNDNGKGGNAEASVARDFTVSEPDVQAISGNVGVTLRRSASDPTLDQALWVTIRNRTNAISFNRMRDFLNRVLRWEKNDTFPEALDRRLRDLGADLHGVSAYQALKAAAETFLLIECGVSFETGRHNRFNELEEQARLGEAVTAGDIASRLREYLGHRHQLPYISRIVDAAFPELERAAGRRDRFLAARINQPCLLELIWSYWHEEGMLMQTMNAISQRFQNFRRPQDRDPLANLEIDPLRPVNNLLWGYIQDEVNRLTVTRRACEYAHEYGMPLYGKAVAVQCGETRSKFLEAFHNLLYQASVFFKEEAQTTVIPDGFPLLNSLQEVHMILAQGAHNQFGDLPWTARVEMMLAQFILGRPEIRDFLQSRVMVPFREAWMPQVDMMKSMQGWSDVSTSHFRDLGVFGEQLLLSIRYGDWIDVNDEDSAKNWARYWRPEIQGYVHAYRAVTGVDLTNSDTVDATLPGLLLRRRLAVQQQRVR